MLDARQMDMVKVLMGMGCLMLSSVHGETSSRHRMLGKYKKDLGK